MFFQSLHIRYRLDLFSFPTENTLFCFVIEFSSFVLFTYVQALQPETFNGISQVCILIIRCFIIRLGSKSVLKVCSSINCSTTKFLRQVYFKQYTAYPFQQFLFFTFLSLHLKRDRVVKLVSIVCHFVLNNFLSHYLGIHLYCLNLSFPVFLPNLLFIMTMYFFKVCQDFALF